MKKLILIFFFISKNFVFAQNIEDVRSMYFKSIDNISECTSLKVLLNSFEKKDNTINAYIGANALIYCKLSNDVFEKFSYFQEGKKMIEEAIKIDPNNLEIKFLRYINQNNTPWFLNYKNNITEDYKFITSNLNLIHDEGFKKIVVETLKIYK
tara:strand:- start:46 stop:504 length:459 start_codon:yes stop_codon:yes gene_type:complete